MTFDPYEACLRDLAEVLSRQREAMQGVAPPAADAAGAPAPSAAPTAAAEPPADLRRAIIRTVMRQVERIAGLQVSEAIEAKIVRIMASVGVTELKAWAQTLGLLESDHPDWTALIEMLTVHETYLFRDRPQLDFLKTSLLPRLLAEARASGRQRLRIWSAGCATGEEAYSLAAIALEAMVMAGVATEHASFGIRPALGWQVEVIGTDISRVVLRLAENGIYQTGPLSPFRDIEPTALRFFPPEAGAGEEAALRKVRADVRQIVRFMPYNLLSREPPASDFDVVACRNVLIYMAEAARRNVLDTLSRALRPSGLLLLGPTDTLVDGAGFQGCWAQSALIWRKLVADAQR